MKNFGFSYRRRKEEELADKLNEEEGYHERME